MSCAWCEAFSCSGTEHIAHLFAYAILFLMSGRYTGLYIDLISLLYVYVHMCIYIYICVCVCIRIVFFHTISVAWIEQLDNWQLAELPQSGGLEFDPRRVHDNLSVPLWVYMRFSVPEHQNQTNTYVYVYVHMHVYIAISISLCIGIGKCVDVDM